MARMTTSPNQVKVRMYRQGLGDCFLLAFPRDDDPDNPVYILIDCGLFYGTKNGANIMTKVANDIKEATNARIDVLVITHEHFDHLSGFRYKNARKVWDTIQIDRIWAAWTEDPDNPVAKTLKGSRALQETALNIAAQRLQAAGDEAGYEHITSLLGFSKGVRRDLNYVLGRVDTPSYLSPRSKKPLAVPNSSGFRCFVLGPPDDDIKLLKKSNPSTQNSEVYEHPHFGEGLPLTGENMIASSILATATKRELTAFGMDGDDIPATDHITQYSHPFDVQHKVPVDEAKKMKFFKRHYGFSKSKHSRGAWRRIDGDWLGAAESLAMQLDNAVNNTSLVLAFQFKEDGKVLLFPGDAQVGNMLSWHQRSWTVENEKVTAEDLLNQTVLYKVGHHGSHNATLKEKGLELMNGKDLTALIPVSKAMAAKQGKKLPNGKRAGWKMPFFPLLDALNQKTGHRVIQADDGAPTTKPDGMGNSDWAAFKKRVRNTSLFVEITVG